MSLGIAFKGPEGIVLAVDSRVTLTVPAAPPLPGQPVTIMPVFYDNATKLLKVEKQRYVAAVTYGAGAIGQKEPRTAHSYMAEFGKELGDGTRLSVLDFATKLSEFFLEKWRAANMPASPPEDMTFLVGGYDADATYGKVFQIAIPSHPTPFEWHAGSGQQQFGLVWGGQGDYVERLIKGFDPRLPALLQSKFDVKEDELKSLMFGIQRDLQSPIPFAVLPLQDSIDLSIFLIRATMTMQRWLVGIRGVGGAIDVGIITQREGFKEIQRKELRGEKL